MKHRGMERCPICGPTVILAERTNGTGHAYLECAKCDFVELVTRKADPFPTKTWVGKGGDGHSHKNYLASRPQRTLSERRLIAQQHGRMGGRPSVQSVSAANGRVEPR